MITKTQEKYPSESINGVVLIPYDTGCNPFNINCRSIEVNFNCIKLISNPD
jgi:hypothetical protein